MPNKQKPVYRGRGFYYKNRNDTKEEYRYSVNQPRGYGEIKLIQEGYKYVKVNKERTYPGVL